MTPTKQKKKEKKKRTADSLTTVRNHIIWIEHSLKQRQRKKKLKIFHLEKPLKQAQRDHQSVIPWHDVKSSLSMNRTDDPLMGFPKQLAEQQCVHRSHDE